MARVETTQTTRRKHGKDKENGWQQNNKIITYSPTRLLQHSPLNHCVLRTPGARPQYTVAFYETPGSTCTSSAQQSHPVPGTGSTMYIESIAAKLIVDFGAVSSRYIEEQGIPELGHMYLEFDKSCLPFLVGVQVTPVVQTKGVKTCTGVK
jgi:hypothetical protein